MEDKEYGIFVDKINKLFGIDLSLYKEAQMNRRLRTLFMKRGFQSYNNYFENLKNNSELIEEFLDRMTINVTEFYRNPTRWQIFEERLIPDLLKKRDKLKIWSAACSTGEEPYTMVMEFSKFLPYSKIEVLATDIDEKVIEQAKKGVYHANSLKSCTEDVIKKFFTKNELGMYEIKNEVKECVTFKKQNLLKDYFETDFDLISCRNVMIYFTEEAKEKLYKKFNDALREGGVFFVGSTEQIFHPEKYGFDIYDAFFYYKK